MKKKQAKHIHDWIQVSKLSWNAIMFFMEFTDEIHYFCLCGKGKIVTEHYRKWHFLPVIKSRFV